MSFFTRGVALSAALALVSGTAVIASCQPGSGGPSEGSSQDIFQRGATPATPDSVVVTVNGDKILAKDVEALLQTVLRSQSGGQPLPPQMVDQMRPRLEPRIIEALIGDRLLDADADKNGVTTSDEELRSEFEKGLRNSLVKAGMKLEEFADQVRARLSLSLEEFVKERAADPTFRRTIVHQKLFEKVYPDAFAIAPETIAERYQNDLEKVYTKPETVRASHILIETKEGMTDEQKQAAHGKAEEALARAKQPDADFGALAKELSSCPSKAQGGDLGFFPREGAMVEPFAAAAFALQPGELSGVIETQFGFHVIKVTDRRAARVVSLEEATPAITDDLHHEKAAELRQQLVTELRKTAEIVYANGKAPEEKG